MPIFCVQEKERFPDYDLERQDPGMIKRSAKPGRVKFVSPGHGSITLDFIELTDEEFTEWSGIKANYEAWLKRIQAKTAALPAHVEEREG